jgi:hypothetical protein
MAAIFRLPATLRSMWNYDVTWYMWYSYIWTDLECGLAIIVASMPSLTPLIVQYIPGFGSHAGSVEPGQKQQKQQFLKSSTAKTLTAGGMRSYPLADIETSARGRNRGGASDEDLITVTVREEEWDVEMVGGIVKTTVIEQTVDDKKR